MINISTSYDGFSKGLEAEHCWNPPAHRVVSTNPPLTLTSHHQKEGNICNGAQGVNQQSTEEDAAAFGVIQGKNGQEVQQKCNKHRKHIYIFSSVMVLMVMMMVMMMMMMVMMMVMMVMMVIFIPEMRSITIFCQAKYCQKVKR